MAPLATLVLVLMTNYAATPGLAAMRVFRFQSALVTVERMNEAGRYASVLIRGGRLEGSPVREPILVEHFSFGWQALDIPSERLCPGEHGVTSQIAALLMRGMPKAETNRSCAGGINDAGPLVQVEAVRRQMRGPLVNFVVVSGKYALGGWFGAGGGQSLYEKRSAGWHLIDSGGGAFGVHEMREYRMPESTWCPFQIHDAACPSRNKT